MDKANPYLRRGILEAIRNQIRDADPPETKETFDRLRSEGYSTSETYRLIGYVFTTEMFEIMKENRVFDRALYAKRLRALPTLPGE